MEVFKNIATLFLSFLVLLSSMSFTFNMHLCMGEVKNIAIFQEAPTCNGHGFTCDMERENPEEDQKENNCCEDEKLIMEGEDDLTKAPSIFKANQEMVAVLQLVISFFSAGTYFIPTVDFKFYSPPLLQQDIPVLIQSFLI